MKRSRQLLAISGLLLSSALLAGCQGEVIEPKPTASLAPSESASPSPSSTPTEKPAVEVAELPYEEAVIEDAPPVELPLAPAEFSYSDDGYAMSAPKVNLPELQAWVKKLESEGWVVARETKEAMIYSVQLNKDDGYIFADAVLSEEQPFTSILITDPAEE